jgi:hypothetical protein
VSDTRTNLHFDARDNVLVVLSGKKTVTLLPPRVTHALPLFSVYSAATNHCKVCTCVLQLLITPAYRVWVVNCRRLR